MTKDEMYKNYYDSVSGDKKKYATVIKRFLKHVKVMPDKQAVERRIEEMRKAGYADGTIEWEYRAIRAFFNCNQIPWPFRRGEGPKIREREVLALGIDDKVIERMVQVSKAGKISPIDSFYLALSTTYGMRRSELAQLIAEDFDLKARLLYVETKKHGRERYHLIPDAILPTIESGLKHLKPTSRDQLTKTFYRIERASNMQHTSDLGWHGFRRMLDRRLVQAGIDELAVRNFMRWKRSSNNMVARYYTLTTVTLDDTETSGVAQDSGDRDIDERVFAVHPFLRFWEA